MMLYYLGCALVYLHPGSKCDPASLFLPLSLGETELEADASVAAVHTSALFSDDQTPRTMLPVQRPSISSPKVRTIATVTIY